ncbi:MAG: D-tyrosyl-tRNA(Tyr) deacylase [Deltaproteobacteria bacterium]|nr:D-tyrosyl-tRNA(Tyr) deacylase [Deltaproteobacteria bacterium]
MRAVIQRVKSAGVKTGGNTIGSIGKGLLIYIGVERNDGEGDLEYISSKIQALRIFEDEKGRMNLDISEAGGEILLVSQFTLLADCRSGKRPSFDMAEGPVAAKGLIDSMERILREGGLNVETGEFKAHMEVESNNDGPVTILIDSRKRF